MLVGVVGQNLHGFDFNSASFDLFGLPDFVGERGVVSAKRSLAEVLVAADQVDDAADGRMDQTSFYYLLSENFMEKLC